MPHPALSPFLLLLLVAVTVSSMQRDLPPRPTAGVPSFVPSREAMVLAGARDACLIVSEPRTQRLIRCVLRVRGGALSEGRALSGEGDGAVASYGAPYNTSKEARLESFREFPLKRLFPLTADRLASAGFVHAPDKHCADRCVCVSCGLALHAWQRLDDPVLEHLRHFGALQGQAAHEQGCTSCAHLERCSAAAQQYMEEAVLPFSPAILAPPAVFRWPDDHHVRLSSLRPGQGPSNPHGPETLNDALRCTPFRKSLRAALAPGKHQLPIELRVAAFHELHLRPETRSKELVDSTQMQRGHGQQNAEGIELRGLWWAMPGSCGSVLNVSCVYDPLDSATRRRGRNGGEHEGKKDVIRACMTIWGCPWVLECCHILSAGELSLACSHEAQARLSACRVGGMHTYRHGHAASGIYLMQLAKVILDKCELEHTELFGLRAYHQVHLRGCSLRDNGGCVFQAIQQAAASTLILTGCAIIHAGDVWFGTRRPGQVIEREGVASVPSISYSTQAISGPGYKPKPRSKRGREGEQFTARDLLDIRKHDVTWLQRQQLRYQRH